MRNASALAPSVANPLVPIAELARRLGVTPRTLRHYQDQGLIRSRRIAHNTRAYDCDTVATIETIVALRDIDLPIAAIRGILALQHRPRAQTEALRVALLDAQADKQRQVTRIDAMLQALTATATDQRSGLFQSVAGAERQISAPSANDSPRPASIRFRFVKPKTLVKPA